MSRLLLCGSLVVSLSGCLGTFVETPARAQRGPAFQTLRWHLLAAPRLIEADVCKGGLADSATYVPPWGLVIGILTFGIVVPQWTIFACAAE
jgi:hypothetical protein